MTKTTLLEDLRALYLREIATLERELALYEDDSSVWQQLPGHPNSAGTLVLHLAGSLQHFFGATFGGTGYVRDRNAEFTQRGLSRDSLNAELVQARRAVEAAFAHLNQQDLAGVFPAVFADAEVSTRLTLLQFSSHLAYHLGQIDYHRRTVSGNPASADALSVTELLHYVADEPDAPVSP